MTSTMKRTPGDSGEFYTPRPVGVALLLEHRFVEMTGGVDLVAAGEMDVANFVDHVAEQATVDHAVDGAFENGRDHVAPIATIGALQAAQVGKEARAFSSFGPHGFFVIHERDQLVAGYAFGFGGPVAPPVRRLQRGTKVLAAHLGFLFPNLFHVVQELQKHHPSEHRKTVKIAVKPFVLSHDVAAGFHDGREALRSGQGLEIFGFSSSGHHILSE